MPRREARNDKGPLIKTEGYECSKENVDVDIEPATSVLDPQHL